MAIIADKIQLKRGLKANLPTSALAGEPLITTDEHALYVGQGAGQPLMRVGDIEKVAATRAQLPGVGVEGKLYIVISDETQYNVPTTYVYNLGAYVLLTSTSNDPSQVPTDETHRFVTDVQIASWDAKQDALGFTPVDAAKVGVANGVASLDATGKVPVSQIPAQYKEGKVVTNIAARDAITGDNLFSGLHVFVVDATGDATVTSGGAEYVSDGTTWYKVAESESMDVTLQWANIQGKPTSTVANIDDAVSKKHAHTNKAVLDLLVDNAGALSYNGKDYVTADQLSSLVVEIDGGTF